MKVLSRDKCEEIFKKDFDDYFYADPHMEKFWNGFFRLYNKDYEICMDSSERSPCNRDSGGPLICKGMKRYIVSKVYFNLEQLKI